MAFGGNVMEDELATDKSRRVNRVQPPTNGGMPGGMPPNMMPPPPGGNTAYGSAPFPVLTGTTNPSGGGPITMNPGNYMAQPGNTSSKNLQTVLANTFNNRAGVQGALLNENEQKLDLNNLDQSPLYKTNLEQSRSATGSAYDQAMVNARRSAEASGFGNNSPVLAGAENGIRASAASELAKAPGRALNATVAPELQAAGIRNSEMTQFDPTTSLGIWEDLVKGKSQASAGMLGSLFNAAATIGSAGINKIGSGGGGSGG
jgi:hypothetical protein